MMLDKREDYIGVVDTLQKAQEIMKNDFMKTVLENHMTNDLKDVIKNGYDWELNETNAWLNTNKNNGYDWKILIIEDIFNQEKERKLTCNPYGEWK